MRRWAEHYEGTLNHPRSQPCQELDDAANTTLPDASIPDDAPSLDEVQRAVRRLRNGRAAGADDIPLCHRSGQHHLEVREGFMVPAECWHYRKEKDHGPSVAVTDQSPFFLCQAKYFHMSSSPDLTPCFRNIIGLTNLDLLVVVSHCMQSWHCVCWRKSTESSNSRCMSHLWI